MQPLSMFQCFNQVILYISKSNSQAPIKIKSQFLTHSQLISLYVRIKQQQASQIVNLEVIQLLSIRYQIINHPQMQIANHDDSISDKISSSVKKSHKISIYSKKSTKSPKKNQPQIMSRVQETRDFHTVLMTAGDRFGEVNSINGLKFNTSHNYLGSHNTNELQGGSQRNMNVIDLSKHNNKSIPTRQQSYQQPKQESNFFQITNPPQMIKKAQTLSENTFATGTQQSSNNHMGSNNRTAYNNSNTKHNLTNYPSQQISAHNISQIIDKQVESQINNLSVLEGSLLTGVRNTSFNNGSNNNIINLTKAKDSQNLQSSQQQIMDNFMKFMHQQIFIAKEKCQKRVNEILKDNAKIIGELKDKLGKNQVMLREKSIVIDKLKQTIKKGNLSGGYSNNHSNGKRVQSQGEIVIKKQFTSQQAHKLHNSNPNSYYEKKITDLQSKISVLQSIIVQKSQSKDQTDLKLEILQKHIINYQHSKLKHLSLKLQSFISTNTQKIHSFTQQLQKLRTALQKHKQQPYGFNQNQLKQQKLKVQQIKKELEDFMGKEFKYENYSISEIQEDMKNFKEQLRKIEGLQFQNSKLVKQLVMASSNHQIAKHILSPLQPKSHQKPQPNYVKLTTLSNINQTASKYTTTNPNMSKISISQLSNTNEYSHLIEKMSPNQKYHHNNYYNDHNEANSNSESLISMNFTEEASESMTPRIKGAESIRYQQNQQQSNIGVSNIAMSKYTKKTDLKQTCSQLQGTPPSASKYYLPTTKTSMSIHSIMAPNESSTQQKILHLNDLKMQTLPLLYSSKQTPQKFTIHNQNNSSKKSIYYQTLSNLQQSLDQNNASYLSIGQMEDFNLSRRDIANQTSDFSDDQFFYYQGQKGRQEVDHMNEWQSPEKSYKTTERFLQAEEFSPMKKKLTSTEQHFYQSTKSPQVNMQQSRQKPMFMYNSNLDYEKFSEDEDEEQPSNETKKNVKGHLTTERMTQNNNTNRNSNQNSIQNNRTIPHNITSKAPLPSPHQPLKQQNLTLNQQRVISQLKGLKKHELPVKMIYDKKKNEGIMRMLDVGHQLNGKSWQLDKKEIQKLQALGYVQVKTYV